MREMSVLAGIHPVREALRAGQALERISVAKGAAGPRIQEVLDLARSQGVHVRFEPREALDRLSAGTPHQGIIAIGGAARTLSLEDLPAGARLVVLLDGIEDPHNLGAVIRTAHAAGAAAVVIPERRAAGLTEAVAKAAAGALAWIPVVRVTNLNRAIEDLKRRGFWTYGLDERGTQDYCAGEFNQPTAFVFGAEGHGLHELTRKLCDVVVRIPMAGKVASLNVSVAAGVVLYEWVRRHSGSDSVSS